MQGIHQVRRKVVILEAMRYDGTNESAQAIGDWVASCEEDGGWNVTQTRDRYNNTVRVQTNTCDVTMSPQDWVVHEANGRFRTHPPYDFGDIFEFVSDEPTNSNDLAAYEGDSDE